MNTMIEKIYFGERDYMVTLSYNHHATVGEYIVKLSEKRTREHCILGTEEYYVTIKCEETKSKDIAYDVFREYVEELKSFYEDEIEVVIEDGRMM